MHQQQNVERTKPSKPNFHTKQKDYNEFLLLVLLLLSESGVCLDLQLSHKTDLENPWCSFEASGYKPLLHRWNCSQNDLLHYTSVDFVRQRRTRTLYPESRGSFARVLTTNHYG